MPNVIAYGALLIWPLITLMLFLALSTRRAIIWSLLGGFLLLPWGVTVAFSGIPDFDKSTVPTLATTLFALIMARRGDFRWPRSSVVTLLVLVWIFCPILTGFANTDPIQIGATVRRAMTFYDALSMANYNLIEILPFILGVGFLRTEESHRDLLYAFVICALIYSIPILEEIRMSPHLNRIVYGVSDVKYFIQNLRWGGFRAMVFLGHGLAVSAFLYLALMASAGLWRERRAVWSVPAALVTAYIAFLLLINKSVGSIVMALIFIPAFMLLAQRRFLGLAVIVCTIALTYPVLRAADLVPTGAIEAAAYQIDPERAQSYAFRTFNEDILLERARERPVLGWGGWGRARILTQSWDGSFRDTSVTDGAWIITLGIFGWVGYIAMFGLLSYPIYKAYGQRKRGIPTASAALVGMLALTLLDLLPNSPQSPITWLFVGALTGLLVERQSQKAPAATAAAARRTTYFDRVKPSNA